MTRPFLIACAALAAAGCTSVKQVQQPGGSAEHEISCGYLNWSYCYEKARELCPDGYKVLSESEGYKPRELRIACTSATRAGRRVPWRGPV